jgi:HK97 family phage portal protein
MASKIIVNKAYAGTLDEYRVAFLSGEDAEEGTMDTESAMKYSAVNACIRVLSETFASAPIILYQKNKDGRDIVTDDTLYDILHNRPNEEMDAFSFDTARMANLCAGGNSVCERQFNGSGELIGLYPYRHDVTTIDRDKNTKKLRYAIGYGTEKRTLSRSQVLHIPNLSFDGVIGLSPLTYAAQAIALGISYEKYGLNFYNNAAMPSGVFQKDGVLNETAFERLKKGIKENYTGLRKAGTPMLLEDGMKWEQVTVDPIDAQLLESKYFQIEDIARIYRVPQHLINKLDRSTNNNIEHQSLEFIMYTMLPYYKRDEGCINAQLLDQKKRMEGMYFERKVDGLLRGDAKSRAEAYAAGRQWGYLSANDIRKLENLPKIKNGDIYLQPANMIEAGSEDGAKVTNKVLDEVVAILKEAGKI